MFGYTLSRLPRKAKHLVSLVLVSYALTHISAVMLIWEVTRHVDATAKEHWAFKTYAVLLRMAHQHTFGHGTMYFVVSAIFLFAGLSERLTLLVITAAFVGAWMDLSSWFLLKHYSANWEYLSYFGGGLYVSAFTTMFFVILYQMWLRNEGPPA